jgi:hypothetical protein
MENFPHLRALWDFPHLRALWDDSILLDPLDHTFFLHIYLAVDAQRAGAAWLDQLMRDGLPLPVHWSLW